MAPPSRLHVRDRLKARLPILVAPMFLVSGPELIKAACRAGVVGIIPALNARTDAIFEQWVAEISADVEKARKEGVKAADYGVNLVLRNNPRLPVQLDICKKYKVPVIVTIMGRVKEVCDAVHSYGLVGIRAKFRPVLERETVLTSNLPNSCFDRGLVFHDVTNVEHGRIATQDGVDGLIAVCAGAGGHAGPTSALALIPLLRANFPDVLIIAGGAISDGTTVRSVQTLGADLSYMGTRFIATTESLGPEGYKKMLISEKTGPRPTFLPTVYTDRVSGLPANFMRKSMVENGMDPEDALGPKGGSIEGRF